MTTPPPPGQPQYGDQPSYGGQPQYGEQPSYGGQPPYAEQPPYGGQPQYGGQQYGEQPQYGNQQYAPPPTAPAFGPPTGQAYQQPPPAAPAPPRTFHLGVPIRPLVAWALLALVATVLVFQFAFWIFPSFPTDFFGRFSVGSIASVEVIVAPLLAVLVATKLGPMLPHARLMGMIALAEYAVALLLGLFAFLFTIVNRFSGLGDGFYAFGGMISGVGGLIYDLIRLALLGLIGLWTLQIFNGIGGTLPKVNVQVS